MASRTRTLPLVVTLIFLACLCALLGAFGSIAFSVGGMRATKADVERSWGLINQTRMLRESVLDAELAQQSYLLTGNNAYLEAFRLESKRRAGLIGSLTQQLSADPVQMQYVAGLQELTERSVARLDDALGAYESSGREAALEIARADPGERRMMDGIRSTTDAIIRRVEQVLEERNEEASRSFWTTVATAMAVNLVAMLVLVLFYSLTRRHFDRWMATEEALRLHNENLESVVTTRTRQLSMLSRHLIRVTDREKAKLARELHDELGSNLTAVNLDVVSVAEKLKATEPALAQRLRRALEALHAVVGLSRRVIEDLHPSALHNMDLAEALRGHCEDFTKLTGLPCRVELDEEMGEIDPGWSIALFRVAQESLTNAAKYASARSVGLSLRRERDGLRLRIVDDGIGIAPDALEQPLSHGLLGMRERVAMLGGTFALGRGEHGVGTVVEAFVPFPARSEAG